MTTAYLLTGSPGTGKTTIVKEAIALSKIKADGFYTEEIRSGKTRQGFRIIALDKQEAILAHVDISSPYKVSKYGIDIDSLHNVGVTAIYRAIKESNLIVIDEIGKMELVSPRFREVVLKALDSDKKVLGTIMLNPHPFADEIKQHTKVKVTQLTRTNYTQVLNETVKWLESAHDENYH